MSRSVAADRDFSALDESRSTNKAAVPLGDRSAPPRAETATTRAQGSEAIQGDAHLARLVRDAREGEPAAGHKNEGSGQQRDASICGGVETNARQHGENSMFAELNETRTRAYDALDLNRNYRQISILLIHRSIKLLEESQLLLKQSSELRSMIWASSRQAVEASFALLSRGRKQDSNEP